MRSDDANYQKWLKRQTEERESRYWRKKAKRDSWEKKLRESDLKEHPRTKGRRKK